MVKTLFYFFFESMPISVAKFTYLKGFLGVFVENVNHLVAVQSQDF